MTETRKDRRRPKKKLSQRIGEAIYNVDTDARIIKHIFFKGGTIDWITLTIVLTLFLIGFFMMSSAQYAMLAASAMRKQALLGIGGIILMLIISKIDYQILNSHWSLLIFLFIFVANGYYTVQATLGGNINRGGSFQPSEILKFAVILCLSYLICAWNKPLMTGEIVSRKNKERGKDNKIRYVQPSTVKNQSSLERKLIDLGTSANKATFWLLAIAGASVIVVLGQSHLSGAIIVFLISMITIRIGGGDKKWVFGVWAVVILVLTVIILDPEIMKKIPGINSYMFDRVYLWLNKPTNTEIKRLIAEGKLTGNADRRQIDASLQAIGSGGWFGLGYGNSISKYQYLAEAKTDFILALVVEELGYIPTVGILGLFAALIMRIMKIARTTLDKFGAMIVTGIATQIAVEVILNVCVVTDTMPNTGITFPFFSYGGTALVMLFAEIGFVLSVSRCSKATLESAKKLTEKED